MSSKAEFTAVSAGKRRKMSTASTSFPSLDIQNLTHLPSDQLVHISGYLSKTSRALFATALTAPPSSWRRLGWKGSPSETSKAIISASFKPSTNFYITQNAQTGYLSGGSYSFSSAPNRDPKFHYYEHMKEAVKKYYSSDNWEILNFIDLEDDLAKVNFIYLYVCEFK